MLWLRPPHNRHPMQSAPPPFPFTYPDKPHVRRHHPPPRTNYRDYKPYLRDEFVFRCVYCRGRELWMYRQRNAGVEHWKAKSTHPEGRTDYSNLLYVCNGCNTDRGTKPLKETWHPEKHPWAEHLGVSQSTNERNFGRVKGRTRRGVAIRMALCLNHDELIESRRRYMKLYASVCRLMKHSEEEVRMVGRIQCRELFGFPKNMPELIGAEGASRPYGSREGRPEWY